MLNMLTAIVAEGGALIGDLGCDDEGALLLGRELGEREADAVLAVLVERRGLFVVMCLQRAHRTNRQRGAGRAHHTKT